MVHHYKQYSQFNWLQKYLQIGYLSKKKKKFKNYQIGWAVAPWHSTCLGCIRPWVPSSKTLGRNYHVIQQFHFGVGVPKRSAIRILKRYFYLCIINTIHRGISHDCQKRNQAKHTSTDEWTVCTKQKNNPIEKHNEYSKCEAATNPDCLAETKTKVLHARSTY